jgi:hypothetical protein
MTMLDSTVLSDRTTATAVSSAEDSNAANFGESAKIAPKVLVSAANALQKQKVHDTKDGE